MAVRKPHYLTAIVATLALALVAVALYNAFNPPDGPSVRRAGVVRVLAWNRDILRAEQMTTEDVREADLPLAMGTDLSDVARPGDERMLAGSVLRRSVLRGDLVRRSDLQSSRAPASRPTRFIEVDPAELEPYGPGRFISTTRTAAGGIFDEAPIVLAPPGTAPGRWTPEPIADGVRAAGVKAIRGKVADAVVPAGAKRLYAFHSKELTGPMDRAAFLLALAPAGAEEFYKTQMAEKGYRLMARNKALDGRGVAMVFSKAGGQYYYVNLHPTDKNTETKAVLMITRPVE